MQSRLENIYASTIENIYASLENTYNANLFKKHLGKHN